MLIQIKQRFPRPCDNSDQKYRRLFCERQDWQFKKYFSAFWNEQIGIKIKISSQGTLVKT